MKKKNAPGWVISMLIAYPWYHSLFLWPWSRLVRPPALHQELSREHRHTLGCCYYMIRRESSCRDTRKRIETTTGRSFVWREGTGVLDRRFGIIPLIIWRSPLPHYPLPFLRHLVVQYIDKKMATRGGRHPTGWRQLVPFLSTFSLLTCFSCVLADRDVIQIFTSFIHSVLYGPRPFSVGL